MTRLRTLLFAAALPLTLAVGCGDKDDDSGDTGHSHTDDGTDGADGSDGSDGADGTGGEPDAASIFASTCANCHGPDGDSGSAPDLSTGVPAMSDDDIRSIITDGKGGMPAQGLSDDELDAMVDYLRATFPE